MREWMQSKIGLALVGAASVVMLASCLVSGSNKNKNYTITLPAKLPAYSNGQYISMLYESYLVGGSPQSLNTGITMSWQESILPLPFNLGSRSALRYVFQEASGSAVQYITQDANRSIFLLAFEGIGSTNPGFQTHTFWPNKTSLLSITDGAPKSLQVFWSPIEDVTGTDRANNGALDFNIVGECDLALCNSFGKMEAFQPAAGETGVGYFVDASTQVVPTPLGDFETYHIRYTGNLAVTNFPINFNASVAFDYRASCLHPGQNGTAYFEGEIWIYPPIGPVKIRNYCVPSVGTPISYIAKITGTNLPF